MGLWSIMIAGGDMPTIETKYNYLLSLLSIQDVDLFEKDAMIGMPNRIYFQFDEYEVVGMSVDDVLNKLLKEKT
jgi:hypothetical protein